MPRDRDGDEYEYADRRGSSSGTKTILIVLGVLGGLALVIIIGCAGMIGFGIFSFQKQMGGMIGSMTASEAFIEDLHNDRVEAAYSMTSANFKTTMSRKQFDEFIAKNPLLTKHAYHSTRNANLPMGNNQKTATMSFVLHELGSNDDDEDDDPDMKPKAKPTKKAEAVAGQPKSIVVTLTLIEENGQWVVDKMTIP